ncbi:E3 ubiquitin- ligase Praja-2 isoform X1 [Pelobates cultripes]|uniref:E3 ubiquitin- ligase Praja-2 isoform X1 n=1 Tax=Pelobates cultripes TaxID=61616 RepID=A0AAD1W7P3_PELCU|nr:E3 ubiquitin- ligase Praja-2 isoform X1 [Pelobates cultripes]
MWMSLHSELEASRLLLITMLTIGPAEPISGTVIDLPLPTWIFIGMGQEACKSAWPKPAGGYQTITGRRYGRRHAYVSFRPSLESPNRTSSQQSRDCEGLELDDVQKENPLSVLKQYPLPPTSHPSNYVSRSVKEDPETENHLILKGYSQLIRYVGWSPWSKDESSSWRSWPYQYPPGDTVSNVERMDPMSKALLKSRYSTILSFNMVSITFPTTKTIKKTISFRINGLGNHYRDRSCAVRLRPMGPPAMEARSGVDGTPHPHEASRPMSRARLSVASPESTRNPRNSMCAIAVGPFDKEGSSGTGVAPETSGSPLVSANRRRQYKLLSGPNHVIRVEEGKEPRSFCLAWKGSFAWMEHSFWGDRSWDGRGVGGSVYQEGGGPEDIRIVWANAEYSGERAQKGAKGQGKITARRRGAATKKEGNGRIYMGNDNDGEWSTCLPAYFSGDKDQSSSDESWETLPGKDEHEVQSNSSSLEEENSDFCFQVEEQNSLEDGEIPWLQYHEDIESSTDEENEMGSHFVHPGFFMLDGNNNLEDDSSMSEDLEVEWRLLDDFGDGLGVAQAMSYVDPQFLTYMALEERLAQAMETALAHLESLAVDVEQAHPPATKESIECLPQIVITDDHTVPGGELLVLIWCSYSLMEKTVTTLPLQGIENGSWMENLWRELKSGTCPVCRHVLASLLPEAAATSFLSGHESPPSIHSAAGTR